MGLRYAATFKEKTWRGVILYIFYELWNNFRHSLSDEKESVDVKIALKKNIALRNRKKKQNAGYSRLLKKLTEAPTLKLQNIKLNAKNEETKLKSNREWDKY